MNAMAAQDPAPDAEALPYPSATREPTADPTDSEIVAARDYLFLGVLAFLSVLNFIDRQLIVSFANFIKADLSLTVTEFALLTGLVFITFYSIAGLFAGAMADIFHRPRLLAAALGLWSILTAASGAARGFLTMAIPRMMIGVGESVCTPTSMSMLSDRFPSSRLGMATAVYYMGVPIGVGLSLLIVGYMGERIGWRACFYLLGVIGVVFAALLLFFMKDPPRRGQMGSASQEERPRLRQIYKTLFRALARSPALSLTIAGGTAMHFLFGAASFDQLWFVAERGFEKSEIARITGWIAIPAGVAGNLIGGLGSDWWQKHTGQGRPLFLFWLSLLLYPIMIAFRLVEPGSAWFWIGLACLILSVGSVYGPTMATVQELVPGQIRGTVIAFYIMCANVIGLGVGMLLGGVLIDGLILRGLEEPYTKGILFMSFLSMVSLPCLFVAGRRFERDRESLAQSTGEA